MKIETDRGRQADAYVFVGPGIARLDRRNDDLEIGQVCVGREQREGIRDGSRGHRHSVARRVTIIQADFKRHSIRHSAASAHHAHRERIRFPCLELHIKIVSRRGVGSADGVVVLKNGHLGQREEKGRLFSIHVVDVVRAAIGRVEELAYELVPRKSRPYTPL